MGWSSGTELMDWVIASTQRNVKDDKIRYALYLDFIGAFISHDWDCVSECEGIDPMFDKAAFDGGYSTNDED